MRLYFQTMKLFIEEENKYTKVMYNYLKKKLMKFAIPIIIIAICITGAISYIAAYNAGYSNGKELGIYISLPNPDKIVYITPKGGRYHEANCKTISNSNTHKITKYMATVEGYIPCRVCYPK